MTRIAMLATIIAAALCGIARADAPGKPNIIYTANGYYITVEENEQIAWRVFVAADILPAWECPCKKVVTASRNT